MPAELVTLLILGCGLGMVHAFDADHILAVSALGGEKPGFKKSFFYSIYWAIGHGSMLLSVGVLLYVLGVSIPDSFTKYTEVGVGLLLVLLGIGLLIKFSRDKIQIRQHRHGVITHAHWHINGHADVDGQNSINDVHKPIVVGLLHGLAGSAPVIALLPAIAQNQVYFSLIYLLFFSLGVMLSMLSFGLGFGCFQLFFNKRFPSLLHISRQLIACAAIVVGSIWIFQAV